MDVGFMASAWQRSGLALLVIGMAIGLVLIVEYPRSNRARAHMAKVPLPQRRAMLRLESSFPVVTWSVSVAGAEIPTGHSDASSWQGSLVATPGTEILIEAVGESIHTQRGAVRVVLDGDSQGERSAWGEGRVITTVTVP